MLFVRHLLILALNAIVIDRQVDCRAFTLNIIFILTYIDAHVKALHRILRPYFTQNDWPREKVPGQNTKRCIE